MSKSKTAVTFENEGDGERFLEWLRSLRKPGERPHVWTRPQLKEMQRVWFLLENRG